MVLSTKPIRSPLAGWRWRPKSLTEPAPYGLKSIFFKGQRAIVPQMLVRLRHIATIAAFALAGVVLGGCSSINERLGPVVGDTLPHWAGGLPKDAPPRKGSPEYDAYIKEQERKRLEPAPANANAAAPAQLDPVH
jgi:hypothetical protein